MPGQVDIGSYAGAAAPGDRSPDALLLTAGTVLGRNASAVGPILPPGYPTVDLGRASTPSDTNEHSILAANAATAGLFAAGVAVGDMWEIFLSGTMLNNSGTSTYTSRLRAYFGAFAIMDATSAALTSNATTREWSATLRVYMETIGAAGTGTLRVAGRRWGFATVQTTGTGWRVYTNGSQEEDIAESTGTSASPALVTNAAQDFNVTATHSNASALITTALTEALVRYYPKNR